MCVPIYLLGSRRTADPEAKFMFHEASLSFKEGVKFNKTEEQALAPMRKAMQQLETDDIFLSDLDMQRVSASWRMDMRRKIINGDIWLTARQLMNEGSGVIDALVVSAPRMTDPAESE